MADSDSDCYEPSQEVHVISRKRRQSSSVKMEVEDNSDLNPPHRATFTSSMEISADMLAGALNDDIGSQEYIDTICGFHGLDRSEMVPTEVKEEEEQSQIPFHWTMSREEHSSPGEQHQTTDSGLPDDQSYIEKLEAEVSRLDHEVTRLEVHSNLLEIRNADAIERLRRMGGIVRALSQANTESQGRLRALQAAQVQPSKRVRYQCGNTVSRSASKTTASVATQTDQKAMEDLQGYQQLCEIVGYIFTDIGHAHTPHDVAEALHPLLKKLCKEEP
ncbi:hypothetical protein F5878DRAFT_628120 [Lentinula raphanica]|uniref:Uncharacterized protein n=1 Tax=Lentinula raphanica TaxID=153919 RepID=A0AA38P2Z3_9AGAR|nr:hypothetical protein F5878DRAFT_628120 [Lentinula raphanica]